MPNKALQADTGPADAIRLGCEHHGRPGAAQRRRSAA